MPRILVTILVVFAGLVAGTARAEEFITGRLLVAAPSMPDPRFAQTVIYMCVHDENGAFGLVLNRRMGLVPGTVVAGRLGLDVEGSDALVAVHWGGPVSPGRGFILHSDDYTSESTVPVADSIAFSVDPEAMAALVTDTGPGQAMFVLGFSGWAPGQLERELGQDDWVVVRADAAFVFEEEPDAMWQAAFDRVEIAL